MNALLLLLSACALLLPTLSGAQTSEATEQPSVRERIQERRAKHHDGDAIPAPLNRPGTHAFKLRHDGIERAYLVHLPPGYRAGTPTPVVFAFHGGGGNMELQAGDKYGLVAKSDSAGFIAVFPNGYSRFPGGKLATWNAGACCAAARDENVDDVGFVRALLARLQVQVTVDPKRIYATGMSNGGMLSYRLACEMADTFRAIAPVAGTDNTLQCKPSRPISVLHIHAEDDDHVMFNGGAGAAAFRDRSKVTDYVSVPETIQRWVQHDQCSANPTRVLTVPGAYCDAYQSCAGDTQVQLCVTETGGHSWPGGGTPRRGKAQASQAISANDVMWAFFQRVSGP